MSVTERVPERVPKQATQTSPPEAGEHNTPVDPIIFSDKPIKTNEKGRYIGKRRANGTPEEIKEKRKKRRRLAVAAAILLALPALISGSTAKNSTPNESSPPSHSNPYGTSPENTPPSQTKPKQNAPPSVIITFSVASGDSEWKISQNSLQQATGKQPTPPTINATTILNAGINMQNGLAPHPDHLAVGQRLNILDTNAVKLINESVTNPSAYPKLAADLKELNSHTGSIEQVAKNEQATITDIQKELAAELSATPVYDRVSSDLNLNPNKHPSFSFDEMWVSPITTITASRQNAVDHEQSTDAGASESSIPSKEVSRLRKSAEEQIVFSRPPKQNLTLVV